MTDKDDYLLEPMQKTAPVGKTQGREPIERHVVTITVSSAGPDGQRNRIAAEVVRTFQLSGRSVRHYKFGVPPEGAPKDCDIIVTEEKKNG